MLSHYQKIEEIGRGGMGCVYKATDPMGKVVAIKMMSNKVTCYPEYRALFQSEVDSLKQMNHPSVVKIAGEPFSDQSGNLYLPMEFISGKTIEQYVRANGPLSPENAISVMVEILDAMSYIHHHQVVDKNGNARYVGCIHRDIKPSNIMIREDGSICIIDFGIAKDSAIGSSGKTVGRIIGTDGYMSPEQATGLNIDTRTDIYSLGCVFYYMLTGRAAIPKQDNDYKTVQAILASNMPLPSLTSPRISQKIDNVFLKAVDKNMTHRFQSAKEFRQALTEDKQETDEVSTNSIPTVRIGRGANNDIIVDARYDSVSTNHLIIRGITDTSKGGYKCSLQIEDISRNGSGINGRKIHHEVQVIDYSDTYSLPQVMLAGRSDCVLNWHEVISILRKQGWNTQTIKEPQPPVKEGLGIAWSIVSLLFPIIGWILWGVWKDEHPQKASTAAKMAWIGFFVNLVSYIFLI